MHLLEHARVHRRREQRPLVLRCRDEQRVPRSRRIHRSRSRRPITGALTSPSPERLLICMLTGRNRRWRPVFPLDWPRDLRRASHSSRMVEGWRMAREVGDDRLDDITDPLLVTRRTFLSRPHASLMTCTLLSVRWSP